MVSSRSSLLADYLDSKLSIILVQYAPLELNPSTLARVSAENLPEELQRHRSLTSPASVIASSLVYLLGTKHCCSRFRPVA